MTMKGFGIYVKNDLLELKHIEKMGVAVWLYMWCLDKMTSINEQGIGKVLGGKPIKYEEIEKELGISIRTYRRWLSMLSGAGYINLIRAPYGVVITVNKAVKKFKRDVPKMAPRSATNGTSTTKSGTSNKTSQYDYTKTIQRGASKEAGDKTGITTYTNGLTQLGDLIKKRL